MCNMNTTDTSWLAPVRDALIDVLGAECVRLDEVLAPHTTFKIGGTTPLFCVIESSYKLSCALAVLREYGAPYFVLGKGSDLLVSDDGYEGVVLQLSDAFANVETKPAEAGAQYFTCEAGLSMKEASEMSCAMGLSGFEFACGIPGTIGGGLHQNAGAYGGSLADCICSAEVVFPDGRQAVLTKDELGFDYRKSRIADERLIVTRATFLLVSDHRERIRERMDAFTRLREEKQPLDLPSAGSTFKRPEAALDGDSIYVGPLIQEAGLQGMRIGGAEVSTKHAGFIVNADGASAQDVFDLIRHVQRVIFERYAIELEPEVHFLGAFHE